MRAGSRRVEFAPGEVPALLALATLAIYGCVPETDQVPTVGWLVAGLFTIEVVTRTTSAAAVHVLAGAIVFWSGQYGATGRGSAIVGAWFAFWPLVLVIGSMLASGSHPPRRWAIGLIGGVAAIAVARTGAIEPDTTPALVAVAIAATVSIVATQAAMRVSVGAGGVTSRR